MCYFGLDEMRQACGGAGFLLSSGIADHWVDIAPFPTFEGSNPVMINQASRLIFKNIKKVFNGKTPKGHFEYLAKIDELLLAGQNGGTTVAEVSTLDYIEKALAMRAAYEVTEVHKLISSDEAPKNVKENEIYALDIARMTRVHMIYLTFKLARERIETAQVNSPNILKYAEVCIKIFAMKQILLDHKSLYESGFFKRGSNRLVDLAYRE